MRTIYGITCFLFLFFGCTSTPKVDTQKEVEAIRNLENQWSASILTKDIEKFLSFPSPNAVFMDENTPEYSGLDALRKVTETWFADTTRLFKTYTFRIDNIEVSSSGDQAYVRGHSQINRKTPKGVDVIKTKIVDIWQKRDGKWKCILSIGNSDNPL